MGDTAVMTGLPELDDDNDFKLPSLDKYRTAGKALEKVHAARQKRLKEEQAAEARRAKAQEKAVKEAEKQEIDAAEQEVRELELDGENLQKQLNHKALQDTSIPEPAGYLPVLVTPQQAPGFDPARLCSLFPPFASARAACDDDSASQGSQRRTQSELQALAIQLLQQTLASRPCSQEECKVLFEAMVTSRDTGIARAAYDTLISSFGVNTCLHSPGFILPPTGSLFSTPPHSHPTHPSITMFISALDSHGYTKHPSPGPTPSHKSHPQGDKDASATVQPAAVQPAALNNLQLTLEMLAVLCRLCKEKQLEWRVPADEASVLIMRLLHLLVDEQVGGQLKYELQADVVGMLQMLEDDVWQQAAGLIWTAVSALHLPHRPFLTLLRCLGGYPCPRLRWLREHLCIMLIRSASPQMTRSNVIIRAPDPSTLVEPSKESLQELVGTPQKASHALASDPWRLNTLLSTLDLLVLSFLNRYSASEEVSTEVQEVVHWLLDWSNSLVKCKELTGANRKKTEVLSIDAVQLGISNTYTTICSFLNTH